jgi:clan AA aspartic protease (TIGR02281 family)
MGGLVKDEREAARLYKLAADQGNIAAQTALARINEGQAAPSPQTMQRAIGEVRVKMLAGGGVYHVPVLINDALQLNFVIDSGASDVAIPADVALTLMRTGTIKRTDFIGTEKFQLADGSTVSSRIFILRSLKIGDRTVTDVRASIADVNGLLLLGQSFLNKFKSWSQDNVNHEIVLQ